MEGLTLEGVAQLDFLAVLGSWRAGDLGEGGVVDVACWGFDERL